MAFAMMRAACLDSDGQLVEDEKFGENMSGAKSAGIRTGCYVDLEADSEEGAEKMADFVLEHLGMTQSEMGAPVAVRVQAIDRTGVMLGLRFPCGAQLEQLAAKSERTFRIRPTLKDGSPSLSGIENRCKKMLDQGEPPEDIAKFCLESVAISLEKMTEALLEKKKLPLLYAGGVMSNTMIRERFTERFGAFFAPPALSSDNAAGTAIIGFLKHERE